MKVNFVHICEKAFFSESKKLCLIEIFGILGVPNCPIVYPTFSFVLSFSGEIRGKTRIVISSPSGKELFTAPLEASNFPEGKESNNIVINLVNFPIPEYGEYKILLMSDGEIISAERKDVLIVQKP